MQTALEMTTIVGVKTNIPLHLSILANSDFIRGEYNTQFLEKLPQGQERGRNTAGAVTG